MKNVAVLIVTFNGMRWIRKTISHIPNGIDIIVVDNNSDDGTLNFLNKEQNVILIKQNKNLGFGKANNIGIEYCIKNHYESVFLLNQDAYVEKDTIEELIRVSKENEDYGIISPLEFNGTGQKFDKYFENYISEIDKTNLQNKELVELDFVNAAGWFIPIKIFEKVGGFDPIFPHYGEDDDFARRVIKNGFKIGIATRTKYSHDREIRTVFSNEDIKKKIFINKLVLFKKEPSIFKASLNSIKIVLFAIKKKNTNVISAELTALFKIIKSSFRIRTNLKKEENRERYLYLNVS